jgi:hypothetical protein
MLGFILLCASAGAERRGGVLCADPAYVVIPQAKKKKKSRNPKKDLCSSWASVYQLGIEWSIGLIRALIDQNQNVVAEAWQLDGSWIADSTHTGAG